jgi:hypothetical protein
MPATPAPPPPMIFAFREMRLFQALLAMVALASGVGTAFAAKGFSDSHNVLLLLLTVFLGLVFVWMFSATLKAPTSFVAITEDRTRIRFGSFVDTVVANSNIAGAEMAKHWLPAGVGVRTNFRGDVALVSTTGEVARLIFRQPIRVWLIPRLIPLRAQRLTVSVRNPQKLVERFGVPLPAPAKAVRAKQKRQRGS